MSELIALKNAAEEFCRAHLAECAADEVEWQETGLLRQGRLRELASLCQKYSGFADSLPVAQGMLRFEVCKLVASRRAVEQYSVGRICAAADMANVSTEYVEAIVAQLENTVEVAPISSAETAGVGSSVHAAADRAVIRTPGLIWVPQKEDGTYLYGAASVDRSWYGTEEQIASQSGRLVAFVPAGSGVSDLSKLADADLYAIHQQGVSDENRWINDPTVKQISGVAAKAAYVRSVYANVAAALVGRSAGEPGRAADMGPWRFVARSDDQEFLKRWYLESGDFSHDVRLYINGDFADAEQRKEYGEALAAQLNASSQLGQLSIGALLSGLREIRANALKKDAKYIALMVDEMLASLRGDAHPTESDTGVSDELRNTVHARALAHSLNDYWKAPSGEGPLAEAWKDKPHRLVYDLVAAALLAQSRRFHRNSIVDEAIAVCREEVVGNDGNESDTAYNLAIHHVVEALQKLKCVTQMETSRLDTASGTH